jgi:heavy metal sensor kinase
MKGTAWYDRLTGSLRFRLTLTYVLFFSLLLAFLGVFFRQTIRSVYDEQLHNILNEEWAAVRGYLRIEKPKRRKMGPEVNWYYDRADPEEALIVDRLRQLYLLADANGVPLEVGPRYRELPMETPLEIRSAIAQGGTRWEVKRDGSGAAYLIRSGVLTGDDEKPYYFAIGRSYAEGERILQEFTFYYSWILPLMIASAAVLGWFMAGRALRPVNEVANAAQRITGSTLATRIPSRGTGDELDRFIEAFNRMTERLDQSFRQTRQFSADVSHELRTPLTAIRGQLEVALMAAKTPEQYQEAIITALEDVERLSQTIKSLLLLSQAESGQLALQRQAIDLGRLAAEIVEQFGIPAESAGLALDLYTPGPLHIHADRIQIERLLSNLISNAIKYTKPGGRVIVTISDEAGEAEIRVQDTGIGIPADHLPYIFDRFYRVPDPERTSSPEKGLGLGLSFVAWIVKAHGGRIQVNSQPGVGTEFCIRLPKVAQPLDNAAAYGRAQTPAQA